jgi:hypothetical protein
MDKFWSILTMPLGVFACFTPVLIAWVLTERRERADKKKDRR